MKKKIGDLTLKEIVKIHKNRKDCRGCPYDSNHLINDYKTHLCRISCSNIGLDLDQEIDVEENELELPEPFKTAEDIGLFNKR